MSKDYSIELGKETRAIVDELKSFIFEDTIDGLEET